MYFSRQHTWVLVLIVVLAGACKDKVIPDPKLEWEFSGLGGKIVYELKKFDNWLYAASSTGMYRKNLSLASSTWDEIGLQSSSVRSFYVFNSNTILASVVDETTPSNNKIYKTIDSGQNWNEHQGGYGDLTNEPVLDFGPNPDEPNTIYASGYDVITKTIDLGASWTVVYGNYDALATGLSFVTVNPNDTSEVWSGGQNGIEQGILHHSSNAGQDWSTELGLMPSPSTAKIIEFDEQGGQIFTGWEGGILKSTDNGANWSLALDASEDNRFFFSIIADPESPGTIYAGGWLKKFNEPQPLIVFESNDGGETWTTLEEGGSLGLFGGIMDMILLQDQFSKKLFIGLYKGGIYEVTFP